MRRPTRGPTHRFATLRALARSRGGTRRAPQRLAWCAVLSHFVWAMSAAADAPLRITGTLTMEASASLKRGSSEVHARLLDDAGHAVAGEEIQVRAVNAAEQALTARECGSRAAEHALDAGGAYDARSDDAGNLCVHFEGSTPPAEFELSVSDPSHLYENIVKRVLADGATRSVEMAFAPAPSVLALESGTQVFSVATRPVPPLTAGEAVEELPVSLSIVRAGRAAQKVGERSIEIGGSSEFQVPSKALGAPGPIEINAEFPGSPSTRATRTTVHAICTASTVLSLLSPIPPSHPESGVRVQLRVSSVAGPVPGGSVEARSGSALLASARVVNGVAELYLQLDEALAKTRPVEVRYFADLPFWLAGEPLSLEIPILPPSPWRRVAWILSVIALGCWLLVGWQRPRRMERTTQGSRRPTPRAPVDVLETGDARDGWHGRVLDAHDGSGIAEAVVLVRLPAFDGNGVLARAQTESDGSFAISALAAAGPGAAVEVRSPGHSTLAAPMPAPGKVLFSLTSRRRTLLASFVAWSRGDSEWRSRAEPTPGEVARRSDREEVSRWAQAVDEAAFGPDPLTEQKERSVAEREPPHREKLP